MNPQLNIEYGKTLKEKGMARSARTANELNHGWTDKAYNMLHHFLRSMKRGGRETFMGEDFKLFAYANGLQHARSDRAFGSVMSRAAKAGLITRAGYGQVSNPTAHAATASIWRVNTNYNQ